MIINWEWNWFTILIVSFVVFLAIGEFIQMIDRARGTNPRERLEDHLDKRTRYNWKG
jgi:hypothetical protein